VSEDLQPRFWRDDWGFARAEFSDSRWDALVHLLESAFADPDHAERLLRGVDEVGRHERDGFADGLNDLLVTVEEDGVTVENLIIEHLACGLDRSTFRKILVEWIAFLRAPRPH
jgi:hypothetical protein